MWAPIPFSNHALARVLQIIMTLTGIILVIVACCQPIYKLRVSHPKDIEELGNSTFSLILEGGVSLWSHELSTCEWRTVPDVNRTLLQTVVNTTVWCAELTASEAHFHGYDTTGTCPGVYEDRFTAIAVMMVSALVLAVFALGASITGFFKTAELPPHFGTAILGGSTVSCLLVGSLIVGTYNVKCAQLRLSDQYTSADAPGMVGLTYYTGMVALTFAAAACFMIGTAMTVLTGGDKKTGDFVDDDTYERYE